MYASKQAGRNRVTTDTGRIVTESHGVVQAAKELPPNPSRSA